MGKMIRRTVIAASALALGLATQTVAASAAPMTLNNCGPDKVTKISDCMYIDGAGLKASEIRGWATNFATAISQYNNKPIPVHEEVTGPSGTICNSDTISVSTNNAILSCQAEPNQNEPIEAGQYCSKVWTFTNHWVILAQQCGNAPV